MKKIPIFPPWFDPMDEYTKGTSLIGSIQEKIQSKDERVHELEEYERTLYCLERLSQQCNMSGLQSFFDYHVAHLYAEILEALGVIKATQMADQLRELKKLLVDDPNKPLDMIGNIPWSFEEDLDSREAEDDFHKKLQAYALDCFNKEDFVLDTATKKRKR